jgi:glutamine synthetase
LTKFSVPKPGDASTLSEKDRSDLGITERIPTSLPESLSALEADSELQTMLDKVFVQTYCAVKRAEMDKLNAMSEDARRLWLVSRY